jgi:Asp-tRNA(Asn)/Glu-tRNA(Gln) amidotransferase A subunit family amidase
MLQSATTLARSLRDGEITSEELVEAYLLRIDKINPAVNAVVALADDAVEGQDRLTQGSAGARSTGHCTACR